MATMLMKTSIGCLLFLLCVLISSVTSQQDFAPAVLSSAAYRATPLIDQFEDGVAYFQVKTPAGPKLYQYIWLTTENQFLRLRIKGRLGAHIALAKTPRLYETDAYEMVIGAYEPPSQSFLIRKNVKGPNKKEKKKNNILSSSEFRDFWISWEGGKLAIGTGTEVGKQEQVSWTDPQPREISAISMDTNVNGILSWQFLRDSARDLFLWSRGGNSNSDIWFTQPVRKHFVFGARGCQAAKIGLSDGEGLGGANQYNTHVIILGLESNKDMSGIKDQMSEELVVTTSTPNILSCKETRYFWVSWQSGRIQVGKGLRIGDNMFLNWLPDETHEIKSVTPFFGNSAGPNPEFHFRNVEENYFLLKSQSIYDVSLSHAVNIEQRTSFVFRVLACYNAVLDLRRKYAEHTRGTPQHIQIILGTSVSQGNKSKILFVWDDGTPDMNFDRPSTDILSCHEYRHLWLAWHSAWLRVGSGMIPYENEIFKFRDPYLPFSVESLHLGSLTEENAVEWQFSRSQAKAVTVVTNPVLTYGQAWLTSAERRDLVFKVKGESTVRLILATYIGHSQISMYTVQISNVRDGDLRTGIWREDNKKKGVFKETPKILSSDHLTSFWVSWSGSSVALGNSANLGEDVVLAFFDDTADGTIEVNAVSIGSAGYSTWQIGAEEGPQLTVYTPQAEKNNYNTFWMTTAASVFPFKVLGEKPCYIALSRVPGKLLDDSIEITIGDEDDDTLISAEGGNRIVTKPTPGILSKDELRPFWVSWFNKTIKIGKGLPVQGVIASMDFDDEIPIRSIGLSSGSQKSVEWKFSTEIATELRMSTSNKYKYDQFWQDTNGKTSQVFSVKAKSDANFLMAATSEMTRDKVYEITIGKDNNNVTVIRKGNHFLGLDTNIKKTGQTPGILSGSEFRTFWASWSLGEIQVGRGPEVGSNKIISWLDEDAHSVHAVAVATDKGVTGKWEFYQLKGEVYHFTTFPTAPYSAVMTTHNDHISFTVWGCSQATITLMEDLQPRPGGMNIYQIIIGRNNDSSVAINRIKEVGWIPMAEETYTDVMPCGQKTNFWVGWQDNLIQLGRGIYPHNIIVEAQDSNAPIQVNAFSFGNGDGDDTSTNYPLQWELDKGAVNGLYYLTKGPKAYTGLWMTVYKQDYLVFTLKTCSDASIALSQLAGISEVSAYEIEIEVKRGSTYYRIYNEGKSVKNGSTFNLKNCDKTEQEYWIGWRNGTIEIGKGLLLGGTTQLDYRDPDPHKVNFLGFASKNDTRWYLHDVQANVYGHSTREVSDGDPPSYRDLWIVPLRHVKWINFNVISCFDARIALSADGNSTEKAYEIVIGSRVPDKAKTYVSSIRKSVGGVDEVNITTEAILHCKHKREFWISWDDDTIRVGEGATGSFMFLQWHIPLLSRHTIRSIAFGSGSTEPANWHFGINEAEAVHGITDKNVKDPERFWVTVHGQKLVFFQVKSCDHVAIYLTSILYESKTESYFIDLSKDVVRLIDLGTGKALDLKYPDTSLLSCTEYRTFWISWHDKELVMGKGGVFKQGVLLIYTFTSMYPIYSVGFDSEKYVANWTFLRSQGDYRTYTSPDFEYGVAAVKFNVQQQYYLFNVKACANAYVLMATSEDWVKDSLELIIGAYENTMVELRYVGQDTPEKSVEAIGLLSCDSLRNFWLDWTHGQIRFGTGDKGSNEILAWQYHDDDGISRPFSMSLIMPATVGYVGEWDLAQRYPDNACGEVIRQVASIDEGYHSNCDYVDWIFDLTLQECIDTACTKGANVINYDEDYPDCMMVTCVGEDFMLETGVFSYDVYSIQLAGETFVAKTSKQLGLNYDQHWVSVNGNTGISFKVKACAQVHLALAAVPGNSETMAYEVIIGEAGNTRSAIRTNVGGLDDPVKKVSTPGVLQCGNFQHLWVSWKDNIISAGQGELIGSEPFIEWDSQTEMFAINAVGLSSELDFDGTFMFGNVKDQKEPPLQIEDETYSMHTSGSGSFNTHRWSISKGYLVFELMACSDAQIILTEVPENYTNNAYRIDLGTANNQQTTITKLPEFSMTPATSDTPDVLTCNESLPFWVEWTRTSITVGPGVRGYNAFVTLQDTKMPNKFNEIAVTTTKQKSGYWDVKKSEGHVFSFTTPDTGEYKEIWRTAKNQNYIVFTVKACNDAHILLSTEMKEIGFVYEVVIGMSSNTASGIRKSEQGNTVVREQTDQILSCNEFRAFWIRWYQGVEVGYGTQVGTRPFMKLSELTTYPFKAMSLKTGWGATGVWHFSDIEGDGFYLTPPSNAWYGHVWVYEQTHFFEFSVRSCEEANIFLSETPFLADKSRPGYEIHIEGANAAVSRIMRYPLIQDVDPMKANATTPGLLDCDYFTKLWISWNDGMIRVGHGSLFENPLLYYHDDKPFPMRALSMYTPLSQKTNAEWQFAKDAGKSVIFQTYDGNPIIDWVTVDVTTTFTYLRVAACSDAEIILSSSAGVTYGHKIILGMDKKSSVLMVPGTEEIVNESVGNPLKCATGVWFWLSWFNGTISMGHGFESGSDIIVAYDTNLEGKKFEFGAIGFRTLKEVGAWEFSQMEGGEIEVSTAGAKGYKHAWLLTTFSIFHFKVQACNDATIALAEDSSEFDINGTKSYELRLGTNGNKNIELWKYTEGGAPTMLDSKAVDSLLDCDRFMPFWLTWSTLDDKRIFRFGIGPDLFDAEMYKYEDTDKPYQISSIGFASENSEVAKWVFKDDAAVLTRLHTDTLFNYGKILYHVATTTSFIFKVKAAKDAHIVLYEHYHKDKAYEFVIGMAGNNFTAIRVGSLTQPVAYKRTTDVLSDKEYRLFWISWANNRLAIGRGSAVGREEIASHNSASIPFIQYLSISTWLEVAGSWEILPERYNTLQFKTPSDQDEASMSFEYGESKKEVTFEVRACSEAQIRFMPKLGDSPNYELVIGGNDNTMTKLYKNGNRVREKPMLDVLSCSAFRKFWLSWEDGQFTLAKGSLAGQRILEWEDSNPLSIHSLNIATGQEQMGDWNIPRYAAPHVRYMAYAHRSYEGFWMTVSELTSYVFRIKAHSYAHILFTDVPGVTTRTAYEIIIGTDFNLKTNIRETKSDKLLVSKPTKGILSDEEYRWFWVSWGHYKEDSNGLIKFGKGVLPGDDEVIRASMTDTIDINGIGFSASNNKNVSWELMAYTDGNFYLLRTDDVAYDKGAWLTPIDQRLSFRVKGRLDARIALLTHKGDQASGYEVLLGGFDNTGSAIYGGTKGEAGTELVKTTGAGTLNPERFKQFWVSWDSTNIRVGEGYTDTTPFLKYTTRMTNIEQINVLGFTSTETSDAEWQIPQNQENSLVLTTQPGESHGQHWLSLGEMDRVVLRVKACEMAKILFVARPDDTTTTSEIVIGLNNKTIIRDEVGEAKASANTPNVLDCNHFRSFWIYWSQDQIYVGMGTMINNHFLVKYEATNLHDIQFLSLASGMGPLLDGDDEQPALWQIFGFRGNTIKAFTPKELNYDAIDIYPKDPNNFYTSFRVRACNTAHFIIAPKTNLDAGTYDVVFGSNDNSKYEILKGGLLLQSVITYNILSAEQFRRFWVNWHWGNLTAGRGEVGQYHAIANYDKTFPTMNSAAFSTSNTCPGNWDIDQRIGDSIQVHTLGEHVYKRIHIMMMDSYSFVFKVKAASSVHIALSVVPTMTQTETWEIGLMANNGKESFIRDAIKGSNYLDKKPTSDLLDKTQFKTFWVSWKNGRIAMGRESSFGLLEIVGADVKDLPDFASVSFSTALTVPADWQFTFVDNVADLTTTTSTTFTTTTTTPTTTTTTRSTSTRRTTSTETTTANTPTSTRTSTTEEAVNPKDSPGLGGGQVAGIVIGVLIGVVLLMLLALLLTLRYKPDAIPPQAMSFIPVPVLQRVRLDYSTTPVHFTNPIFGEEGGLNQNKISFGAVDTGEPLNDFNQSDT